METEIKTEVENNIENINFFTERVNYYFFDMFHLHDFELFIDSQTNSDVRATCYYRDINEGTVMINICYSLDWINNEDVTLEEIDKVAFHEVWEAILSELTELASQRFITKKDIPTAIHRVIHRMENVMFPMIQKKFSN